MPRIIPRNGQNQVSGSSANYHPEMDIDEIDMDTADRGIRDRAMRGPMHETRESESDARNTPRMSSPDIEWRQPMSLDAPPPRPGMAQRWIRMNFRDGSNDTINVQGKNRIGWSPRDPSTVPEGQLFSSLSTNAGQSGGLIRVGNLVLHEISQDILVKQRRYIRQKTQQQEEAVVRSDTDKASREGQRAGYDPIVREERAQVTTGRRPSTLAD